MKHNSSHGLSSEDSTRVGGSGRHRDSLQRIDDPVDEFDNRESTKDEGVSVAQTKDGTVL